MTACSHTNNVTCDNCRPRVCGTCGACPTCGRGGYERPYQPYPYQPYPFIPTTWPHTVGTGDSASQPVTKGVTIT